MVQRHAGGSPAREQTPIIRVKSPASGRLIVVGGPAYQKMLAEGYVLHEKRLVHKDDLGEIQVSLYGKPGVLVLVDFFIL